jgi:dipeptidyl aminopeptidase/acylaminoacyl peptidase
VFSRDTRKSTSTRVCRVPIVGTDFCLLMLLPARAKTARAGAAERIRFLEADTQSLADLTAEAGAGEAQALTNDTINYSWAHWFPDGKRILVTGNETGKGVRLYVFDIASKQIHPISPEGVNGTSFFVSPDSQWVAGIGAEQHGFLYPVNGGEPRPIKGLNPGEQPITWSADGRSLYIYQPGELPARVDRLDLETGQRTLWKELMPSDPAGVETIGPILMTPDASTCVFGYHRMLSDLYLVEGLK